MTLLSKPSTACQAVFYGPTKADAKEVEARRLHEQVLASAKSSVSICRSAKRTLENVADRGCGVMQNQSRIDQS